MLLSPWMSISPLVSETLHYGDSITCLCLLQVYLKLYQIFSTDSILASLIMELFKAFLRGQKSDDLTSTMLQLHQK